MFKIFDNKKETFGLDISDKTLKIVQLKRNSDKIKIQAISRYKLKDKIVVNGEIRDQEAFIKSVKECIKNPIFGTINTNEVVISIPEKRCFIKQIEVDKGPNQINDSIGPEIEKYFPYSIDDVYFDWQINGENEDYYEVLVSAAPKYIINTYIDSIERAGLSVIAMEPESLSLARTLIKRERKEKNKHEDSTFAIVDIGAMDTFMVICSNKKVIMSMGIDVSGQEITKKIATTLQISESQAEKAKIICGLDKNKAEGIIHDILLEVFNKMTGKISSALNYYSDNYPNLPKINNIYITGGGSNIKNLNLVLKDAFGVLVQDGDVFENIDEDINKYSENFTKTHNINIDLLSGKADKKSKKNTTISSKHNSSLSYATSIGIALRAFI